MQSIIIVLGVIMVPTSGYGLIFNHEGSLGLGLLALALAIMVKAAEFCTQEMQPVEVTLYNR